MCLLILRGLKLNCQSAYVDTSYNSLYTVLLNIYRAFVYAAMRYHNFVRCLRSQRSSLTARTHGRRPNYKANDQSTSHNYAIWSISLSKVAIESTTASNATLRRNRSHGSAVILSNGLTCRLGLRAFHHVLRSRPASYAAALTSMQRALQQAPKSRQKAKLLCKVTASSNLLCFQDVVF